MGLYRRDTLVCLQEMSFLTWHNLFKFKHPEFNYVNCAIRFSGIRLTPKPNMVTYSSCKRRFLSRYRCVRHLRSRLYLPDGTLRQPRRESMASTFRFCPSPSGNMPTFLALHSLYRTTPKALSLHSAIRGLKTHTSLSVTISYQCIAGKYQRRDILRWYCIYLYRSRTSYGAVWSCLLIWLSV